MRNAIAVIVVLLGSIMPAAAQVSVGIGLPGVSIGINLPTYPQLVPVPGYPVYYAPQLNSNYFFYDGMYWVFDQDNWYESAWYNGPWRIAGPDAVPLFLLRVPVRYYRRPPEYFRGWAVNGPPRWDRHWGNGWAASHRGWDRWNRNAVPARAPLPTYQRQYSGNRYPRPEQQQTLRSQNYRYQPRSAGVQQPQTERRGVQRAVAPPPRAQGRPASPPPAREAMPQPRNSPPQARAPAGRGPQGSEPARGPGKGRENERGKGERGGDRSG